MDSMDTRGRHGQGGQPGGPIRWFVDNAKAGAEARLFEIT